MNTQLPTYKFQRKIKKFYKQNKRDFPWRRTSDPYKILVSEVMLQQTQAKRVEQKYKKFLERFPTIQALSNAKQSDVLAQWQGLGYNRRAIYLKKAAEILVTSHKATIPGSIDELKKLPGVGSYTAGALLAFIFNKPSVFIETNIRRVFIHEFCKSKEHIHDSEIFPLIEKTLDKHNPREWYYALMDYGNYLTRFENANRKSKHYKKQSKFEGSKRKVRSDILRHLLDNGSSNLSSLKKNVSSKSFDIEQIVLELEKEKFLKRKKNHVVLV